ncbi:erg10, acetyl-CoA C-acetyltransferase [Mucor velutinosus]|uniref:Transcription initiation factor TFIID subunit 2 n=1 Tax=Mucor velutinosus TaxID=708070 RepID=A0AAN7DEN8_9FUNG|nr:erg10, acetyl-CoA C-acetyltransferase [Mucor velutinosus]
MKGLAELTVQPLNNKLTNIRINCRQCKIEKAFVNDMPVEFEYNDAVSDLTLGANTSISHHQVYKSRYMNALRDADEGELIVKLPANCINQVSESEAQSINKTTTFLNSQPESKPQTPQLPTPAEGSTSAAAATATATTAPPQPEEVEPTYNTIVIRIEYTLEDPRNGVVYVQKDDEIAPYRSNHVYTVNQPLPGATRSWLPCIDRISERCTWDMEFIVPRKDDGAAVPEYDGEGSFDEANGIMVVCSGDIIEQVIHPTDNSKKIVHYNLSVPTPAPFIGFAIGPFEMIKLSPSQLQEEVMTAADLDENQQQSLMAEINMMSNIYAFALPGLEEELSVSCSFLMHAMHFYTQEYGSYPFSDYKLVFVEDTWADTASSASLAICSSRLLHPVEIIDQIYSTRRELSQALARQWFGIYIVQKSWPDTWLVRGLANLMGSLFIKRHLGNNEYRLRLKKDMELCCMLDVNRPPVYNPALPYPLDPEDLDFIELKAPLVIYMLDKRMCKGGGTLGLSRVLPKILVSAMSGELAQNAISTHYFLRLCRKVSGFDTKVFAEQWIYRSGCPKFSFSFLFNRKKMVVEIFMRQENTNTPLALSQEQSGGGIDGSTANYQELMAPLFTGNLTVRIHEADGTPYEHILDIQSTEHKFEVQFNTKYKRIRRNTKRFLAKQAAAAAAVAEEEQENEEGGDGTTVLGIIPSLGLGMPIFEDAAQKKEWKIIEWGQDEEDTSGAASAMFDWIRLDAEFEWLCICEFKQPDYMWAAQLTKDRDVVAQHEAIDALKHMPSLPTSTSLLRAVLDPKCFYKIRMEAAYGLASCAKASLNWVGLHQLNKMFQKRYCFPVSSFAQQQMEQDDLPITNSIPKPNNFSNLPDYFIQKATVVAFSQIRDERGLTPVRIRQFLLDLLKYNDNIGNEFSDCYYVATLVSSLGDSLIPASDKPNAIEMDDFEGEQVTAAAKAEIERFRTLDYVIPTYHNIITVTCLRTMTKLMLKNLLPVNIPLFMQYTRYGNYLEVRLAAIDSLFILCGLSDHTLNHYLLDVVKEDPCVYVSHYVARAMLAWLGLAMRESSDTPVVTNRFVEEFAEEEGRVVIDDERGPVEKTPQQQFQASIESLRKRFENDTVLQENLWNLLNSSENTKLDHCIRKYLLQFCEYMFKPIDVGLKVTIRVPTLPSTHDMGEDTSEPSTPTSNPVIRFSKPKQKPEEKASKSHKKANSIVIKTESISQQVPEAATAATSSAPSTPNAAAAAAAAASKAATSPVSIDSSEHMDIEHVEPTLDYPPFQPMEHTPSPPPPPPPPKIKHKKVDSATAEELKKCRRVINKLNKSSAALPFTVPVDEELDGAPGYYQMITHPMDLGQIKSKVENKEYKLFSQFEDDVRLMLSNCFKYNGPGTFVYNAGMELEATFEKELSNLRGKADEETQNMTIVESPVTTPRTGHPSLPPSSLSTSVAAPTSSTLSTAPTPSSIVIKPPKPAKAKSFSTVVSSAPPVQPQQPDYFSMSPSMSSPGPAQSPVERKKSMTPVVDVHNSSHKAKTSSVEPKSNYDRMTEKEKMSAVLNKTMSSDHAYEFLRPVDPIKQGIPQYTKIIKHPMDLGTIKSRLVNHQYPNAQAMDSDMRLMFRNCYTFNPPNTYVYDKSKLLEEDYNKVWKTYFGSVRRGSTTTTDKKPKEKHATPPVASPVAVSSSSSTVPAIKIKASTSSSSSAVKSPKAPKAPKSHPTGSSDAVSITASHEAHSDYKAPSPSVSSSHPTIEKPSKPKAIFNPAMTESNQKRCERIYKKLYSHQACQPFYEPVDAVALNIPLYYTVIKRPMDMSTIRKKLDQGQYQTIWEFELDVRQIFWNCNAFNDNESWVAKQCVALEAFFNQIWSAEFALPNALKGEELKLAQKVINKLTLHDQAALFNVPVDLESLPDYALKIKQPMDLRTIWEKLESGKYTSLKAVDQDVRLVFKNCFTYNAPGTYASDAGKKLEKYYHNISREMRNRIATASSGSSASTGSAVSASPKRPHSSSPAPPKMAASTSTLSTDAAPAPKKVKVVHAKPIVDATHFSPTVPSQYDYMDVDSASPAVVKSPSVVRSPSVSKSSPVPKPSKPTSSSHAVSNASPSVAARSPANDAPVKLHPSLQAKMESLVHKLMNRKESYGFHTPVDPVAFNIPHYPRLIKHPMDFGTMLTKLQQGQYKTVKEFESDMRLIFTNCYTFNGFDHVLSQNAKILEQILNKEGPNLRRKEEQLRNAASGSPSSHHTHGHGHKSSSSSSADIPRSVSPTEAELRKYQSVLDKIQTHPSYYAFGAPVDAELLGIPTYHEIVRRPMDFGTIRHRYMSGGYDNANQLLRDVKLVFYNCYLFNLPDDVVTQMGRDLQTEFNRLSRARGLRTISVDDIAREAAEARPDVPLMETYN